MISLQILKKKPKVLSLKKKPEALSLKEMCKDLRLKKMSLLLLVSTLGLLLVLRQREMLQEPVLRSPHAVSKNARYDGIFMVMGERKFFPKWYSRLAEIDGINIDFVYGSWDKEIEFECVGKIRCDTMHLSNTTWTTGRNAMALRAAEMEVARGKKYDYWMFADDDLDFVCDPDYENDIFGKGSCWQKYFDFVISDYVTGSNKISSVGTRLGGNRKKNPKGEMVGATSFTDAFLAVFKRSAVPYLLPYVYLRPGMSQWMSQAAVFCIMKECMPQSQLIPPPKIVKGVNQLSREYVRGQSKAFMAEVAADNFNLVEHDFSICNNNPTVYPQFGDEIYENSPEALWNLIPESDWEKCKALKIEYWDKMIAHLDYRGVK